VRAAFPPTTVTGGLSWLVSMSLSHLSLCLSPVCPTSTRVIFYFFPSQTSSFIPPLNISNLSSDALLPWPARLSSLHLQLFFFFLLPFIRVVLKLQLFQFQTTLCALWCPTEGTAWYWEVMFVRLKAYRSFIIIRPTINS